MEENSPVTGSPPLPKKGSYSIDFDNLDEFSNPFESKSKMQMGSSPPINLNNMSNSDENIDPFKSKKTLANSPPGSPRDLSSRNKDTPEPVKESDSSLHETLETSETSLPDSTSPETETVIQKKKKVIKKPQAQSKFKPPKNLKKHKNNGDIQILMPPDMEADSVENTSKVQEDTKNDCPPQDKEIDFQNDAAFQQTKVPKSLPPDSQLESKLKDNDTDSVGCSNSTEEFKDAVDWSLQSQNSPHASERLSEEEKNSTLQTDISSLNSQDDDKLGFNLSCVNSAEPEISEKHPALRALEAAQQGEGEDNILPAKMSGGAADKKDTNGGDKKDTVVQVVQGSEIDQVLRYSQTDWNKLKQELELNFQATLLNKERDWSRLLADRDKKIGSLEEGNKKLKATRDDMRAVVTEFEKTIAQLQGEKEKLKSDSTTRVKDLEDERNQALEDLSSVENSFSDLHRRYEKSKTVIEGFKRNEEELKECLEDLRQKLQKSEAKLGALKSQAEEKLDKANEDIDKIKKSTKSEVARLEAALKKSDLRISSLEEALSRKEKENHELTAICDELIAKVGS